jgi:hypothetical protein
MLPLLIMGASAAIGVAGAFQAGSSAKNQADGEAALYRAQAAARLAKAEFDAETSHRKYRREKGQVEARASGSGVSLESFYDVMNDDAMEAALERAAIRWSAQSEASMLEYQASAAERRGKDTKTASYINAVGAVVSPFSPLAKGMLTTGASGSVTGGVTMSTPYTAPGNVSSGSLK